MGKLLVRINRGVGRTRGRITSYHRGGAIKQRLKLIDFRRDVRDVVGRVFSIERTLHRTSRVALVSYSNGYFSYILENENLAVGDYILHASESILDMKNRYERIHLKGISCKLEHVLVGKKVCNVEYFPGKSGQISRSAGTFCFVRKKYSKECVLQLPSGEYRIFSLDCYCTLGRIGNRYHKEEHLGKAGVNRRLGRRPIVRGRAMNPVDHPHGGRTNGGVTPRTPWGLVAKGVSTRKKKRVYKY